MIWRERTGTLVTRRKRRMHKFMAALLLCSLLLSDSVGGIAVAAGGEKETKEEKSEYEKLPESLFTAETTYYEYLSSNPSGSGTEQAVEIDVTGFSKAEGTKVMKESEEIPELKESGPCVVMEEDGYTVYPVTIEQSGWYSLYFEYFPLQGKGIDIEKEILLNGKRPYAEASALILNRVFRDEVSVRDHADGNGNEMRPKQVERSEWMSDALKDGGGYYSEPMLFYLEEGVQELSIYSIRETCAVRRLVLQPEVTIPDYQEVAAGYQKQENAPSELIAYLEAEEPVWKSSPMIIPTFDRSSPKTSPSSVRQIKLNIIGGDRFKIPGQWMEYEFEVPADGLYKIGIRAKQSLVSGTYSLRKLSIDGKVPFKEAGNLRIDYGTTFSIATPVSDGKDCLFYLTAGRHTLRIEATLGSMTEYIDTVQGSLSRLNEAYRQILMLTGPTPDLYRDYEFLKEIPQVFECFAKEKVVLAKVSETLQNELGCSGENLTIFKKLDLLFGKLQKDPEELVKQMNNLKNYIGALGTWMLTVREQPLDFDGIYIGTEGYEFPEAEGGFFARLWYELKLFLSSFFSNFNEVKGEIENKRGSITVWTSAARDYVTILRQMIDEDFSNATGIEVNLQLVGNGALLPSTLAGIGPDVALSVPSTDVLNYAARGAILDLSQFDDIEKVKSQFMDSALLPMEYNGGFYGLPETQTFPVLFYRKDILAQMGLSVPKTWKDVCLMLTEIQKKNMTFGLKTGMASFGIFLYQLDGTFYDDSLRVSAISSDQAVQALRMQTDMFISYQLPQKYDFANRFRTGEMPIGVEDYTTYNLLSVFAPEIKGLWGFAPVPGIEGENGINHSCASTVTASVVMSATDEPELAYEFIRWFTGVEAQLQYARELETILGPAARYHSANVEAVKGAAWTQEQLDVLLEQWKYVKGIPEVPGGYYTSRYMDFAFRAVVLSNQLPREVLMEYEDIINEEMSYKRLEFGLD